MDIYMTNSWRDWSPAGDVFMDKGQMWRQMEKDNEYKMARVYSANEMKAINESAELVYKGNGFLSYDAETLNKIKRWWSENGFNADGVTFCIIGNSYSIKDKLKEYGYCYHPTLGWHGKDTLSLPFAYQIIPISFSESFVWNLTTEKADPREKVGKLEMAKPKSEWVGSVGEKIYNINVTLVRINPIQTQYGLNNIYTFVTKENNILTWFTKKDIGIDVGSECVIKSAIIKTLDEYNSDKQTVVKNLIIA